MESQIANIIPALLRKAAPISFLVLAQKFCNIISMAEIVGILASSLTLATLFRTCLEAFDLVQTSRHQENDLKKLKLRLNIEKCRLYIWGKAMGLTDQTGEHCAIDVVPFPLVREILETLSQLFDNSHKVRDKYGCRQATNEDLLLEEEQIGPLRSLAASFSNFKVRSSQIPQHSPIYQKVIWVIHDREKFRLLVSEIKGFVDSLQDITKSSLPIVRQAGIVKKKIVKIDDAETLSLIAEVCSNDHPDIADAASSKADTISSNSFNERQVAAWSDDVEKSHTKFGDRGLPDIFSVIESMTVTDLKHALYEKLRQEERMKETNTIRPDASVSSSILASQKPFNLDPNSSHSVGIVYNNIRHSQAHFTNPWITNTSATEATINGPIPMPLPSDSLPVMNSAIKSCVSQGYGAQQSSTADSPNLHVSTHTAGYDLEGKISRSPFSTQQMDDRMVSQANRIAISDAIDASRGMLHLQNPVNDITPRNIYEAQDTYAFPQSHEPTYSDASSISSASIQPSSSNLYKQNYYGSHTGSISEGGTDYSSVSEFDMNTRRLPASHILLGPGMPPAPQSMMGQFSRTVSSSSQKKHKCKICERKFTRPSSLQTHMYSHTGEKPFACEVEGCGRRFSVVSNLRRHRKVHRGEGLDNPSLGEE